MKRLTLALMAILVATSVLAQDKPPAPDYSKDNLLRLFKDSDEKPKVERNIDFGIGYVQFKALGQRWRIAYLPIMLPLPGSIPWRNDAFGGMPDPFALTGTTIPYTPRTWRDTRAMNAEMKRIEKSERAKVKVSVGSSETPKD